jgi:hypothetical protein
MVAIPAVHTIAGAVVLTVRQALTIEAASPFLLDEASERVTFPAVYPVN